MKNFTIIILLFLIGLSSKPLYGQIQLNSSDIYSTGSYKINRAQGLINPRLAGENKIWDFSTLEKLQANTLKIEKYTDNGKGIDANLVEILNGDTTEFLKKTSNAIYTVTGNKEGGFQNIKFIDFPCNYGMKQQDSALNISYYFANGKDSLDSIRVTTKIYIQSETDAWGVLKIPFGEFNSLRLKIKISYQIKQEGKKAFRPYFELPGSFLADTFTNYQWYTQKMGNWLLYYHDKRYVRYLDLEPVQTNIKTTLPVEINVTNPIGNSLEINNTGGDVYNISLIDMGGRQLIIGDLEASNNQSFDIASIASGIYFLKVENIQTKQIYLKKLIK
jgi:hypothetical protein